MWKLKLTDDLGSSVQSELGNRLSLQPTNYNALLTPRQSLNRKGPLMTNHFFLYTFCFHKTFKTIIWQISYLYSVTEYTAYLTYVPLQMKKAYIYYSSPTYLWGYVPNPMYTTFFFFIYIHIHDKV